MFDKQDSPTVVYLARHGETTRNVERRFQGVGDSPLSLQQLWLPYRGGNCFLSVLEVTADAFRPLVIYDGCHIGERAGLDGTKSEAMGTA